MTKEEANLHEKIYKLINKIEDLERELDFTNERVLELEMQNNN